ncbi:hypothetical protein [Streptomyces nanshensis]|uniref:hypothetical protein n=1 Tax=Streptomyces nanshensis TaxID=518642 RepID=UPI001495EE47|nr:hypothetical protein [Streptomyces nanshensis]
MELAAHWTYYGYRRPGAHAELNGIGKVFALQGSRASTTSWLCRCMCQPLTSC